MKAKTVTKLPKFILGYLLMVFVLLGVSEIKAQDNPSSSQGYSTYIITLSGSYPESINFEAPQYVNPYSLYTPFEFKKVGDSTYTASIYTYGNTLVTFKFEGKTYLSILQPKVTTALDIHYSDIGEYDFNFSGPYEDVFDNSHVFEELFASIYQGKFELQNNGEVNNIEELREKTISQIQFVKEKATSHIESADYKYLLDLFIETFYKYKYLKNYESELSPHDQSSGDLESLSPNYERDSTFFKGILTSDQFDPKQLFPFDFELLTIALHDTLLGLPENEPVDYVLYLNKVKSFFGAFFNTETEGYFYERIIAAAYLDQINDGRYLSNKAKFDISTCFEDKELVSYILHQNEVKYLENISTDLSSKYYLPFHHSQDSILPDILSEYEGKVIIIDLWATWCGPCIENFDKIKWVKDQFKNQDDLVFVYLTDESSERSRWESFTDIVSGEHYYLYNEQYKLIAEEFDVQYIPSYLLFNKKGELYQKSLGEYMGNEKLMQWIEATLKK